MNPYPAYFIVSLTFLFFAAQASARDNGTGTELKKDIAFIVRKPDKAKNIAIRFHVAMKTLKKLNIPLRRNQMLYAGKRLVIPLWLRRKDTHHGSSGYDIADYILDTDSLDAYIREDFVCMSDIEADTIRRIAIDKEIKKIEGRTAIVNKMMDSIEEVGMQTLSNRDIRKMPMERARRAGSFAIGVEADSLQREHKKLSDEKDKIDLRFADYEYLVENAPYMATHTSDTDNKVIQIKDWGDDPNKTNMPKGKNNK
jgi:hypothetical protein